MIYRVRTIDLAVDKADEAVKFLVKVAAYATEHYPEVNVEILTNIAGSRHQAHMVTRCGSLAVLEQYEAKREPDAGWQALVKEWQTFAPTVSSRDSLYRIAE